MQLVGRGLEEGQRAFLGTGSVPELKFLDDDDDEGSISTFCPNPAGSEPWRRHRCFSKYI